MTEETKKENNIPAVDVSKGAATAVAKSIYGDKARGKDGRKSARPRRDDQQLPEEFEQKILDIARVTRVMAGGKRMRFRACVAVGNKKGRVAIGLAKGIDVTIAITKAVNQAKKNFIDVPMVNDTIPHQITHKKGAAIILLKPASQGRGIVAGGAVRIVAELAGIKNITCKTLGTNNKLNNAKCIIEALSSLKMPVKKEKAQSVKKEETVEVK
ncbi:MAG: 30S ribosomal protein S5 [Parcubacteria group bacterium GW2011_GWE2_39_37]|uniref:Small ribosomal subunit protein uS5 n=1 Tax=Candidatus Falkowbacteria bacterium GW2011_GWF2_39_8 TaxID=1618642 RepID=A0A0G0SB40_9BACT|nr:MAG: 30S ribosomal protein S5 [Parcubacteria group bacterium GW2011_GWE2_39_37]KKR31955.1 MAG: 30S ribosomal protein S5 [Candidatus Falkowbacteria bacterium GW2011_GWF2_39_8]